MNNTNTENLFFRGTILAVLLIVFNSLNGQQFIISSMGSFPNTVSNASAIHFKSNTSCIDVQTGIAVLNTRNGNGTFEINCTIQQKFNTLGTILYPNPTPSFAKLKFRNAPPFTENFKISIWNPEGHLMNVRQVTGYQIFQGLNLNLTELNAGNYILKIESPQFIEALKFIKVN